MSDGCFEHPSTTSEGLPCVMWVRKYFTRRRSVGANMSGDEKNLEGNGYTNMCL
jgi:hypothetical protein